LDWFWHPCPFRVDGILLDLGVSTEQLENRERGFSFRFEAPLDMRMSKETESPPRSFCKTFCREIGALLKDYGEERWAHRVAKNIVRQRKKTPIRTTREWWG